MANDLVSVPAVYLATWMESFRPVREKLLAPLAAIFRDGKRRETERSLATDILADYAADQPPVLADLLMDADEKQFAVIYPKFKDHGERGLPLLTGEIDKKLPADLPSSDERRGEAGEAAGECGGGPAAAEPAGEGLAAARSTAPIRGCGAT